MIGLPSLLLVIVVLTHYGGDLLATMYLDQAAASRAWFYVLRGLEGGLLFLIVWSLTPVQPLAVRYGASLACAWGALEEFQTAACRLAIGIDQTAESGLFRGLCDVVTGWPVYMLTITSALLVAALRFQRQGPGSQS